MKKIDFQKIMPHQTIIETGLKHEKDTEKFFDELIDLNKSLLEENVFQIIEDGVKKNILSIDHNLFSETGKIKIEDIKTYLSGEIEKCKKSITQNPNKKVLYITGLWQRINNNMPGVQVQIQRLLTHHNQEIVKTTKENLKTLATDLGITPLSDDLDDLLPEIQANIDELKNKEGKTEEEKQKIDQFDALKKEVNEYKAKETLLTAIFEKFEDSSLDDKSQEEFIKELEKIENYKTYVTQGSQMQKYVETLLQMRKAKQDLTAEIEKLKKDHQTEIDNLNAQITKKEGEIVNLNTQIKNASTSDTEKTQLQQEKQALEQKKQKLEVEVKKLQEKNENLEDLSWFSESFGKSVFEEFSTTLVKIVDDINKSIEVDITEIFSEENLKKAVSENVLKKVENKYKTNKDFKEEKNKKNSERKERLEKRVKKILEIQKPFMGYMHSHERFIKLAKQYQKMKTDGETMTEKQKKTIEAQVFEIQVQKVFLEVLETFDFTQEFAQENTCVDAFFRAMNKKLENKTLSDDLKNKYQSVIEKSYENIQEFVKQVKKLQQQVKQLETEKSSMKTLAEFNTKEQQIKKLEKELEELKKKAPENTASEEFTKMEKKLEDMEKKLEFAYKEFVKLTGEKAFAEGENKVLRESNEILNKHLITLISNHQNLSLALSKNLDTVTEKLTAVFGDSFTKVTDAFIRMAEVSKNENNNNPDDTEPPKNPSGDGGSGGAKATVQGSGNSENTFKNVGSPVFNINIPSRSSPEHTSSEDTFKKQKKNTKNESLDHNNNDDDDDDDDTPGGGGRGNGGGKGDDNNRKTQKNSGGGSESKDSSSNTASEETQPEISAQEPEQPAPKTPEKPNTPETEQQSSENTPENPQNTSSETQQAETTNNNPQTAEDFELRFPNDPALARLHFLMSERDKAERQGKILLKQILNKKITDVKNLIETKEGLNYMNEYYTIEKQLKNPELNRYERKNLEKRKEYVYDMAHNARTKPLDFAPYGNSIRGSTLNKYIRHKLGNVLFGDFVQDSEGKYYQKGLLPFAVRNAWEGTKIGAKTVVFSASLIAQAANAVVKDSFRAIDDVSLKPLRNTLRIGANTIQVIASMLGIPVSLFKLEKMHKYEPILNGKTIDNANKLVNLFPYLQRKTDQSSEEEEKVA